MSAEERPPRISLGSGIPILVLAAAIGGWAYYSSEPRSFRPPVQEMKVNLFTEAERVPARLWEDPFYAARYAKDADKAVASPVCRCYAGGAASSTASAQSMPMIVNTDEFHRWLRSMEEFRGQKVLVMGVLIKGGDFAEDVEERRRQRQAVLAALNFREYQADKSERMGVYRYSQSWAWNSARPELNEGWARNGARSDLNESSVSDLPKNLLIPFELFTKRGTLGSEAKNQDQANLLPDRVLVLWLDQDQMSPLGLALPAEAFAEMMSEVSYDSLSYCLIGPSSSDSLEELFAASAMNPPKWIPRATDTLQNLQMAPNVYAQNDPKQKEGDDPDRQAPKPRSEVETLADVTNAYLDKPLPEQAQSAMLTTFSTTLDGLSSAQALYLFGNQTNLSNGIRDALPSVEDSDKDWARTVVRLWRREHYLGVQDYRRFLMAHCVVFLDAYLDDDLPETGSGESSVDLAVAEAVGIGFGPNATSNTGEVPEVDVDEISKALSSRLGFIEDSDTEWAKTAAEQVDEAATLLRLRELIQANTEEPNTPPKPSPSTPSAFESPGQKETRSRILEKLMIFSPRATVEERLLLASDKASREAKKGTPKDADANPDTRVEPRKSRTSGSLDENDATFSREFTRRMSVGATKQNGSSEEKEVDVPHFFRTVATDDVLALGIVKELERRGIDLGTGDNAIALVSEWDTLYGRSIGDTFADVIRKDYHKDGVVQPFTYLRGLDGATPGEKGAAGDSSTVDSSPGKGNGGADPKSGQARATSEQEAVPFGRDQRDYMRRLTNEIRQWSNRLENEGKKLRAIGVVGTDVYDKQIVLQALKPEFPEVVFFTTDLDALLFHGSQYHWSRNLIVASSYGLCLCQQLQPSVPPFRDSYQTSTYLACLLALGNITVHAEKLDVPQRHFGVMQSTVDWNTPEKEFTLTPANIGKFLNEARLYELGRSGPVDITPRNEASEWLHREPAYPPFHRKTWGVGVASLAVALFGLVILWSYPAGLCPYWPKHIGLRLAEFPLQPSAPQLYLVLILGAVPLLAVAMILAATWTDGNGRDEPLRWFDGVSVWPTELVRLVAITASLLVLYFARRQSRQTAERVKLFLGLPEKAWAEPESPDWVEKWPRPLRPLARKIRRTFYTCSIHFWCDELHKRDTQKDSKGVDVAHEGRHFTTLCNCRRYRVILHLVVLILFGRLLYQLLGSDANHLIRGPYVRTIDYALWAFSHLCFLIVSLYLLDMARGAECFLRWLGEPELKWPAKVRSAKHVPKEADAERLRIYMADLSTEGLGRFLGWPFALVVILLAAHITYFDAWPLSVSAIIVYALVLGLVLLAAWRVWSAAEGVRDRALVNLKEQKLEAIGAAPGKARGPKPEQIEAIYEQIARFRRGVFGPFAEQAVFRAVLLPFGGGAAVAMVNWLSRAGW